ncbi:hypothetical protein CC1G_12247 [Coprinopsis cinerea okayama7|uniref:DUF6533 domain-containing protein n=1 Tax=Coprinopsis cinerea (strain Okayama-7 / 130 / ATCC MYA-4618 / FGSC 9003) TaxID=240176 RepID=A8P761_COPC7|nr:hypothetical protein CC1G_12247 [Coprinopsis cinerea okayama7\|eukprot:XP_001839299.2 hypothetical protein CC1G_12247 [Coprinopsis cinerea okayama7\
MDPQLHEALVSAMYHLRIFNNIRIATVTAVIADYFQTFDLEVKHVWSEEMSPVKVLYFLTRYSIFIHYGLVFHYQRLRGLAVEECRAYYIAATVVITLNSALSSALIYIQVWGWAKLSRPLGIYLVAQFIISYSLTFFFEAWYFRSILRTLRRGYTAPLSAMNNCF